MGYCSDREVRRHVPKGVIALIVKRLGVGDDLEAEIALRIEAASNWVEGVLFKYYKTPFAPPYPAPIVEATAFEAASLVWADLLEKEEIARDKHDRAVEILNGLKEKGSGYSLDGGAGGTSSGIVQMKTRPKDFDFSRY